MIGYLTGTVLRQAPEALLLDVGGVGYKIHIPLSTFYELQHEGEGATVALHIHTHVRDDAIELFGFWTEREKLLFEKLIGVSGIGPKLARVILSGMTPEDLLSALANGDAATLSTIPGIGKKTAERMVVDLQDRVQELAAGLTDAERPPTGEDDDLVDALVGLGYRQKQAEQAVAKVREAEPEAPFHEILRISLKRLSGLG